ncbi:MAG TPA: secretin N-terminal domain-containing protein [Pyrinomonadaceae bacterium]
MLNEVSTGQQLSHPSPRVNAQRRNTSAALLRAAARKLAAVVVVACLLCSPAAALSSKGQKNFKRGMEHEAAQQWEKAVEEFALAVAADPSNAEYQLHYRRSVFNASQLFMRQGGALAERGDYIGAYNAFRRAHDYDQANALARSMMERMYAVQLNKATAGAGGEVAIANDPSVATVSPAGYEPAAPARRPSRTPAQQRQSELPQQSGRAEQLQVITYSGDLESFIKYLAKQLRLNAVFDKDFPRRAIEVDLSDVTAAQALDYVFLTQGLFFQKLTSRTILVADQTKRPQYQQLVLKTFYLSNIDPNEARTLIQASIPPQAGRQPVITANKTTNSITVRDTVENVRLVSELIRSVDKDRAEVVMDVQIYEVSRTDLMQIGNQVGGESSLTNFGGIQPGSVLLGGARQLASAASSVLPLSTGIGLLIPQSSLSAFQRKDNTRLIASTQVHAFDGEKSTAHIGQRVPVQTATITPFGTAGGGESKPQEGVAQGLFGANGYPVIQYEKTGLTLEFTPQVAPNLDVQVKMSIKSNDVSSVANATLTPTFTERNIEGTARIQNNRTMMIASVAQNQQSRGRQGLPLLGLVPILGRLFTAPRRNDQQTDIVIAVTPHVLRAPTYTPRDEEMRPSGTMQTPNSDTLEAMVHDVEREEQIAAARSLPTHSKVELPDAVRQPALAVQHNTAVAAHDTAIQHTPVDQPSFVPAPRALMNSGARIDEGNAAREATMSAAVVIKETGSPVDNSPEVPATTRPRVVEAKFDSPGGAQSVEKIPASDNISAGDNARPFSPDASLYSAPVSAPAAPPRSAAQLMLMPEPQRLKVGERRQLKLVLKTDAPLGMIASSLRFDPRVITVRAVSHGNIFADPTALPNVTYSVSTEGVLIFSVAPPTGRKAFTGAGVLLNIEIEAVAPGACDISFGAEDVHLMATDGRKILLRVLPGAVAVAQ